MAAHISEAVQLRILHQIPIRARRGRIDTRTQSPKRSIRVDRHHQVLPAQFGQQRADNRRRGGLTDPALAQHANAVYTQLNPCLQVRQASLERRLTRIDQPKCRAVEHSAPSAIWRRPARGVRSLERTPVA
jgi:hypothetical protein